MKRGVVIALEEVCGFLDRRFPKVYWCKYFAYLSSALDERWDTGVWTKTRWPVIWQTTKVEYDEEE